MKCKSETLVLVIVELGSSSGLFGEALRKMVENSVKKRATFNRSEAESVWPF
jgi:hypothetical protein